MSYSIGCKCPFFDISEFLFSIDLFRKLTFYDLKIKLTVHHRLQRDKFCFRLKWIDERIWVREDLERPSTLVLVPSSHQRKLMIGYQIHHSHLQVKENIKNLILIVVTCQGFGYLIQYTENVEFVLH